MQLKIWISITRLQVLHNQLNPTQSTQLKRRKKNSTFSQKLAGEEVGFTHSHAALALCFVTPGALLEFLHWLKKKLGFSGHDKCTAHSSVMPTEEPDQTPADDVKP